MRFPQNVSSAMVTIGIVFVVACQDSLAPYQPEITNAPGNFQFQITDARNVTLVRDYAWQNNGTSANVDQSSAITSGSAALTILDSQGTQVYTRSLTIGGSSATSAGTPGVWTIRVSFTRMYATVNFRVQTP